MTATTTSFAAALLGLACAVSAGDQGVLWMQGAGGSWHDPANWSTGAVPDADDLAVIPGAWGAGFVITGDGSPAECRVLQVDQAGVTFELGGELITDRVISAADLTLRGTTLRDRLTPTGAWTFGALTLEQGAVLGPVLSTVRVAGPLVVTGSKIEADHCDARAGLLGIDATFAGVLHSVQGAAVLSGCEFPADHVEILGPTLEVEGGSMQPAVSLLLQDCEATLHAPATGGLWADVVRSTVLVGAGGIFGGADSIVVDSTLEVRGGSVSTAGVFDLGAASELRGGGEIDVIYLDSAGLLSPGGAGHVASLTTPQGEVWMRPTSRLRIDVGGEEDGEHDRIAAAFGFRLAGVMDVRLVGGFQPASGSEFLVLDGPVQSGTVELANAPELLPGLEWALDIDGAGVRLVVRNECVADFDGDGEVTTGDVLAFLDAWTQGDSGADIAGDGVIDTRDLTRFLNVWVAGC